MFFMPAVEVALDVQRATAVRLYFYDTGSIISNRFGQVGAAQVNVTKGATPF